MRKLPPLTELRAFEAAALHLSFKMAAAELSVTPTAISHQVELLERHCGQPLFRRRPRPLVLTWAGQQLFPVVRDGFETFAEALTTVRAGASTGRLRITATNAFAARWLMPRLPNWRDAYPRLKLDIVGTDAVLDLNAGEADIAIRYARKPPSVGPCVEFLRDSFYVVASPKLVGQMQKSLSPAGLTQFPLIEIEWPPTDAEARVGNVGKILRVAATSRCPIWRDSLATFRRKIEALGCCGRIAQGMENCKVGQI